MKSVSATAAVPVIKLENDSTDVSTVGITEVDIKYSSSGFESDSGVEVLSSPLLDICDLGSDGSKSPYYSDISSVYSPDASDSLGLDWNDSFTELFPQLDAC